MGRNNGLYWTCSCGRWSWISKKSCVGCGAPPPSWVLDARASTTAAAGNGAARSANGEQPTLSVAVADYVTQPKGKRQQAKARGVATATAAATASGNLGDADHGVGAP